MITVIQQKNPDLDTFYVPAWAYIFCRPEFSTRAFAAWLLLSGAGPEGRKLRVRHLRPWLARELGITRTNVVAALRAGEGLFWRRRGRGYRLHTEAQVWRRVSALSVVSAGTVLPVQRRVLRSPLALLRAYLARAALSNGPEIGTSEAWSSALLGRSERTVRAYRRLARAAGILATRPVYARVGKTVMDMESPRLPELPQEFVRGTTIYRRQPDLVLLTRPDGSVIDALARNEDFRLRGGTRQLRGKRYFRSGRQLREWQEKKRPVAADAIVRLGEGTHDWHVCFPPQYKLDLRRTVELSSKVSIRSLYNTELYCGGKDLPSSEPGGFTGVPAGRNIELAPSSGGVLLQRPDREH